MNINKAIDKAFYEKTLKELAASPIHVLNGITKATATKIEKTFGTKTIAEFGNLSADMLLPGVTYKTLLSATTIEALLESKYVKLSKAIALLAELEE